MNGQAGRRAAGNSNQPTNELKSVANGENLLKISLDVAAHREHSMLNAYGTLSASLLKTLSKSTVECKLR